MGPNGAGKTNLLESLHVGSQGFSPRTRSDRELVRFGEKVGRVTLHARRGQRQLEIDVILRVDGAKTALLNGAALRAAEQLRREVAVLVFTPERLAVVKGGPAARRAYFDRVLGRLFPARASLPAEYGAALAQRNAALRRVAAGYSSREALTPWTRRVAETGTLLVEGRREVIRDLAEPFRRFAAELGLPSASLLYDAEPPSETALESRLGLDLERGVTGLGPHLDDVTILSERRDLRSFGSQGEQRLAVLALLLAERELVAVRRETPPLLLLDDVLSELDAERRRLLARLIVGAGQTMITATAREALPVAADQLVEVSFGAARAA